MDLLLISTLVACAASCSVSRCLHPDGIVNDCCFAHEESKQLYAAFRAAPDFPKLTDLLHRLPAKLHSDLPPQIRGENATAANVDKFFTVYTVESGVRKLAAEPQVQGLPQVATDVAAPEGITPSQIINIAKAIWTILENNRPSVNVSLDYATATPEGITNWTQLENWQSHVWPGFYITTKNMFGLDLCSLEWNFEWAHHGDYDGVGQYITQARAVPINIDAHSFAKMSANGLGSDPMNAGNESHPVAQLSLQTSLHCVMLTHDSQAQSTINIRGDGTFECIAGCNIRNATQ